MGSLYRRRQRTGGKGDIWQIKYRVGGRVVRESTGTDRRREAERILKEREGRVAAGLPVMRRPDRVMYDEAAADLRAHYTTTGSRNLVEVEKRLAHTDKFFLGWGLVAIDGAVATRYVAERQAQGAANGTVNRELAVLVKMLRLAAENRKLMRLPVIRKLKEAAPRAGFLDRPAFEAVRKALPSDLAVAATIAYELGWRMQSEVLTLTTAQVDLEAGRLRLEPGSTKNGEGREAFVSPELRALLVAQVERVRGLSKQLERVVVSLFPHLGGRWRGQRRRDFRKAWATACKAAGVPGLLKHDLRRSAVRNLVRAEVSEHVAMSITGHKTRSVFDRYDITTEADRAEAAAKVARTFNLGHTLVHTR